MPSFNNTRRDDELHRGQAFLDPRHRLEWVRDGLGTLRLN